MSNMVSTKKRVTIRQALRAGSSYGLLPEERLSVWQKTAGTWAKKKNLIKTLTELRRGWQRKVA